MLRDVIIWRRHGGREAYQHFVGEPAPIGASTIAYSTYDVFISHKGEDTRIAESVGDALQASGLSGYLDRWDPAVEGDSPELEIYLRSTIRETKTILAIVTENTPLSWWVPFEIGVARETDSQIATFLEVNRFNTARIELPSYLRKWPILASTTSLQIWAHRLEGASVSERRFYFAKEAPQGSDYADDIDPLVRSGKVVFRSWQLLIFGNGLARLTVPPSSRRWFCLPST